MSHPICPCRIGRANGWAHGADKLSNAELIAIVSRTGMKGMSAIHIAEQLLRQFGTCRISPTLR
jgi:DNA repair protein RadC